MDADQDTRRGMVQLLEGRQASGTTKRPRSFADLKPQERAAVREIAAGDVRAEPRARATAIAALREDPSDESLAVLRSLVTEGGPPLQVRALQAIPRERAGGFLEEARSLIRDGGTPPEVALAAARTAIAAGAEEEVVDDLQKLRERLLPLVSGNSRSPSIACIDRLIAQAQGGLPVPAEQPKPVANGKA